MSIIKKRFLPVALFFTTQAFALEVAPTISVNKQNVTVSWPSQKYVDFYEANLGSIYSDEIRRNSYTFTNVPYGTYAASWFWCEKGEWINEDEDEDEDEYEEGECFSSAATTLKLYRPALTITSPANNATIDTSVTLTTTPVNNGVPIREVKYYLDNTYKGSRNTAANSFNYGILANGTHTLKAIALSDVGNESLPRSIMINVSTTIVENAFPVLSEDNVLLKMVFIHTDLLGSPIAESNHEGAVK